MVVWNSHVAANYYHQLGRWWCNMLVSYVYRFNLTVHNSRTKLHSFSKGHRRMELPCCRKLLSQTRALQRKHVRVVVYFLFLLIIQMIDGRFRPRVESGIQFVRNRRIGF